MEFLADFHIHSKYSRATAKNLDLENLYIMAQIKGLTVLGTGDFTHPGWWLEIEEKLEPSEEGLLKLKPSLARACDEKVPPSCRRPVRFMLVTEISNIYKKEGSTRKNHNLVFMPHPEAAGLLNRRLDDIGNIRSDGRPILGLDARNLLEIVLETTPGGYLIPAHIWTPWFSLLGSKSGFDSVDACFEDLTEHIFALETGLSSDPPMNWRVSNLDRYTLVSNSDAHSPAKLGREANCFNTDLSYPAIRDALRGGKPREFSGTIEFYPEEGKYHVDGHRKCAFRCRPDETRRLGNRCPRCGRPLTLGVLHRVEDLADRDEGTRPHKAAEYRNLIPLEDLLAEVLQVGPKTKKTAMAFAQLIQDHGSEFDILCRIPRSDLEKSHIPLLAEAICRMRDGRVIFEPGFDGEFGRVRIFDPEERSRLQGQQSLFDIPESNPIHAPAPEPPPPAPVAETPVLFESPRPSGFQLNERQQTVVDYGRGPLLISAGPGTGKTRAITCRMVRLMEDRKVAGHNILAVTFTNKAAREMRQRLTTMLPAGVETPLVTTFHGLGRQLLREAFDDHGCVVIDETARRAIASDAVALVSHGGSAALSPATLLEFVVRAKQLLLRPDHDLDGIVPRSHRAILAQFYGAYQRLLTFQELHDYEDLILEAVDHLETDKAWRRKIRDRYRYIFVDEFQDIDYAQYRLLRAMAPPAANICVIGDPDQAIYGFRGSDLRFFKRFGEDFPQAGRIHLTRNYRSSETILDASYQVIRKGRRTSLEVGAPERTYSGIDGFRTVSVMETPSAKAEAVAIGRTIENMVGGTGFHSIDFDKLDEDDAETTRSFADFAILCRTGRQVEQIARQLTRAAIPCQWVSRKAVRQPALNKLMAAFRVITGQGGYADFGQLSGLSAYGISNTTMDMFKQWAYGRQLTLQTALRSVHRLPIPGMSTKRQHRLAALVRMLDLLAEETSQKDVADTLRHIVARTTLASRVEPEPFSRMIQLAQTMGVDKAGFGTRLALQRDTDLYQPEAEKVAVMTLHAAKGLEFPVVFVAGCEENLLPLRQPGRQVDMEEERRLFFVGLTRARARLILTWARRRTINGETRNCRLSHFVADIEDRLKTRTAVRIKTPKAEQEQLTLF